jgi:hypothetical protein
VRTCNPIHRQNFNYSIKVVQTVRNDTYQKIVSCCIVLSEPKGSGDGCLSIKSFISLLNSVINLIKMKEDEEESRFGSSEEESRFGSSEEDDGKREDDNSRKKKRLNQSLVWKWRRS